MKITLQTIPVSIIGIIIVAGKAGRFVAAVNRPNDYQAPPYPAGLFLLSHQ